MIDSWWLSAARGWDVVFGTIGIVLNTALIALIVMKTPETLKTYSVVMLTVTIADSMISHGSVMVTTRIAFLERDYLAICRGFHRFPIYHEQFDVLGCMLWTSIKIYPFIFNNLFTMASDFIRVARVKWFSAASINRWLLASFCYVGSHVYLYYCVFGWIDYTIPFNGNNLMFLKYLPEVIKCKLSQTIIPGKRTVQMIFILIAILPAATALVSFICRCAFNKVVTNYNLSASRRATRKIVQNQHLIQVLLSVFSSILLSARVRTNGLEECEACEVFLFAHLPFLAVINPIVTIASVPMYRTAFFKIFTTTAKHLENKKVVYSAPSVTLEPEHSSGAVYFTGPKLFPCIDI